MTKTKEHRKLELVVAVLSDALIDTRDEADRYFEAKRQTAGEHMRERSRRQNAEHELRRLRSVCRQAADTLSRFQPAGDASIGSMLDSKVSITQTLNDVHALLVEAGRDDESS